MKNNIAILFRGPIRPNAINVARNIKSLKDSFKDYSIETFLVTWDSPNLRKLQKLKLIDNYLILKMPDDSYIDSVMTARAKSEAYSIMSNYKTAFKQFWSQLMGLKMVISYNKFDYIVSTRTDLKVIIDSPQDWLKENLYLMPIQECHYNFNDQFGIADPKTMLGAWNYQTLENLVYLYNGCENPENCLANIMKSNNISYSYLSAKEYELDRNRFRGQPNFKLFKNSPGYKTNRRIIFSIAYKKIIGLMRIIKNRIKVS